MNAIHEQWSYQSEVRFQISPTRLSQTALPGRTENKSWNVIVPKGIFIHNKKRLRKYRRKRVFKTLIITPLKGSIMSEVYICIINLSDLPPILPYNKSASCVYYYSFIFL